MRAGKSPLTPKQLSSSLDDDRTFQENRLPASAASYYSPSLLQVRVFLLSPCSIRARLTLEFDLVAVVKLGYTAQSLDVQDLPVVPHHLRSSPRSSLRSTQVDSRADFGLLSGSNRSHATLQEHEEDLREDSEAKLGQARVGLGRAREGFRCQLWDVYRSFVLPLLTVLSERTKGERNKSSKSTTRRSGAFTLLKSLTPPPPSTLLSLNYS